MPPFRFFVRALALCAVFCAAAPLAAADLNAVADRNWIKLDSAHFSVITDEAEAIGRQLVNDLEALRHVNVELLGVHALIDSKPLTVFAVGNKYAFRRLGFPENWGGVFLLDPIGAAAVASIYGYGEGGAHSPARMTLLHEYHHFLSRLTVETQAYPMWYDEGMADYWATFHFDGDKVRLGDEVERMGRVNGLFNDAGRLDIDTASLFNTVDLPYTGDGVAEMNKLQRFYARAHYTAHYFNSTPALRAELTEYVRLINLGYRQDRAAPLAFKRSYAELDRDIEHYLRGKVAVRVIGANSGKLQFPKVEIKVARLGSSAVYANLAATLPRFSIIDRKAIRPMLDKNLELNPDDPDASVYRLIYGALPNADEVAADLEQRFPRHAALLVYRGDRLRMRAYYLRNTGGADWLPLLKQARNYYRRAIAADPSLPGSYFGLGMVYHLGMPAGEPLAEGVVGLDSASIYFRRAGTFSALAGLLKRMNRPLDALPALRSAAAFSKASDQNPDALLLDNLEMLNALTTAQATPGAGGLSFAGGTQYLGPVRDNKPDGKGKLTRPNGSYYEGRFVKGLPSGVGQLAGDGGFVYQGEFERGIVRGKGKLVYPPGGDIVSYEGGFEMAKPSGQGVTLARQGRFEGSFDDGVPHGAGVFTAADKAVTLQGDWRYGAYDWPADGNVVFTGPIDAAGRRHGKGICRDVQPPAEPVACEFKDGARARL